jgi:prephenate dehydrogenase
MGTWREALTSDEAALIEWLAGEEMTTFGYHPLFGPPSRLALMRGLSFAVFDTVRKRLTQFPGMWYQVLRPTRLSKEEFWMHVRAWQRDAKSVRAREPRAGVGL